ncbi:hypothetical protein V501_09706 [Pseudogymnoascus sp. VKM F-4519 (FW-2642)]|nr:hypothetical protein V501_09706 [Pseudogymnoascus sp. VKM F-4519 (FW-2642)]
MEESAAEILVLWILTGLAVAMMLLRLGLKQYRSQRSSLGDYITIAAIVSILLRGAVINVALLWGTNNISTAVRKTMTFTPEVIYRREIGSRLTIVNRVFYTVYSWLQKGVVMCILQRLLKGVAPKWITKFYWITLAVTFVAALIVTFTECHPFKRYWQVVPDPGTCSKGIIQLEVFSALSMVTDAMLIALPLPHLMRIQRPFMERLRLFALFLVGLTILGVTMARLLMNVVLFHRSGQSHNVANIEIFFAAFVANAPTIYGLLNVEGRRGAAGAQYLPDSYSGSGSKSIGGIRSNVSRKDRGLDSGNYQSGHNLQNHVWAGKSRYAPDSDEEMMIVSPSPVMPFSDVL